MNPSSMSCMFWKSWHIIYTTTTVQFYGCWNTATKRDASGLLQAITNFEFVETFVIGYLYLSQMSALTTKLQRKSNDIFKAFTMVSSGRYKTQVTGHRAQVTGHRSLFCL